MCKIIRFEYFKKLFPFLKHNKNQYIGLIIFKMLFLVLSLLPQIFYLMLINDIMVDKKASLLLVVIAGYISIFILQTSAITLNKITYNKLFFKFKLSIRTKMLKTFGKMDAIEYEKYSVGDLKNRIDGDVLATERFFSTHILNYVFSIVSVIVISIILIYMNIWLALIGFAMVPASFWFTKFMGKKVSKINEERREIQGEFDSFLFSSFSNWKEIKANNLEDKQREKFLEYKKQLNPLFVKNQIYWYINRGFIAFKDFFITKMNLYFIGGILIISGNLNVGILLVFMNYYGQFFDNISEITASNLKIKNDIPNLNRVIEILNFKLPQKETIKNLPENISFIEVSFKYYEEQELVLKNVNLEISPKEHIAVVGRSGCGKTTLSKLLMGLYSPKCGSVCFGEYNIKDIAFESIGNKIGIVLQDPPMFNLTIRENLKFANANANASDDEYIEACKKANIYDFIDSLPDKFDTIIGERGIKLSGGQKQRLSIARTILKNPEIIIFDEATSSLDSENEKAIVSAIKELSKGKTVITIAHRLSTILSCDKVVVMDNGEIIATGKHQELRSKNEIYDLLFENQYVR